MSKAMWSATRVPGLRSLEISSERVADVLTEMGILLDDRRPSFEDWLERKLNDLAPGIRCDVETWLRTLHAGGPRTKARDQATVWNYLNQARPALLNWSARYEHLREITRDDVSECLDTLHGSRRRNALGALRSLFGFCTKKGMIFRNPTARMKVGQHEYGVVQPLTPADVDRAVAASTTPVSRLILALAALHAARSKAIRELLLDDVDLGNRFVIAGPIWRNGSPLRCCRDSGAAPTSPRGRRVRTQCYTWLISVWSAAYRWTWTMCWAVVCSDCSLDEPGHLSVWTWRCWATTPTASASSATTIDRRALP
jgi:hypothetical protein